MYALPRKSSVERPCAQKRKSELLKRYWGHGNGISAVAAISCHTPPDPSEDFALWERQQRNPYKQQITPSHMEMISLPQSAYNLMKSRLAELEALEQFDSDVIGQFKESLEDVKSGRIRRVA